MSHHITYEVHTITRSLEDFRRERLLTIEEFARLLGMTDQTYRRLLNEPKSVRMPTKRYAREVLGVSPFLVKEFYPTPSPTLLSYVQATADRADKEGWITYDAQELNLPGEQLDGNSQITRIQPRIVFSPAAYVVSQQLDDWHRRRLEYALAIAATGQGGVPGDNGFEWITSEDTHVVYRRSERHALQIILIEIRQWQPFEVAPGAKQRPDKGRKKVSRASQES